MDFEILGQDPTAPGETSLRERKRPNILAWQKFGYLGVTSLQEPQQKM